MGLDIDASYDEIEKAYADLIDTYSAEPKRKIKLQVAKDKILEDRLRQRLSGGMKGFSQVVDPFDRKEEKPLITIPPALQGVMELPTQETLVKNLAPLPIPKHKSVGLKEGVI